MFHSLLKELEANPSNLMGPEPDIVQVLICKAIEENGPENFVGIRQVAIYTLMCWGPAKFEEIQELELRQVRKIGTSLETFILKGKRTHSRSLKRCIIHPTSLHEKGKMCPVDLIDSYLVHRKSLGHNSDRDHLFPQVDDKYQGISSSYYFTIQIPKVSITFDI